MTSFNFDFENKRKMTLDREKKHYHIPNDMIIYKDKNNKELIYLNRHNLTRSTFLRG